MSHGVIAYRRRASLVVATTDIEVEQISRTLGIEPDWSLRAGSVRADSRAVVPAAENSWELRESSDWSVDMSSLLRALGARVIPLKDSLIQLKNLGCGIKLDLVQWLSPLDPVGPGFSIDYAMIQFLVEVGGFIDVDQYVETD
jgi:hypothetical protein